MTREIKFRAWDKRFKKFDYGRGDLLLRHNSNDFEEIQQYTGLKDKNGKDIYEGDIVLDIVDNEIWEIIFKEGSFCIGKDNEEEDTLYPQRFPGRYIVIGNKYEDPELLTNK